MQGKLIIARLDEAKAGFTRPILSAVTVYAANSDKINTCVHTTDLCIRHRYFIIIQNDSTDSDMSFCRGSVNCHGSDGQMYHFYESSRSGEIFFDQYRGVGVFIPRDEFIRIGLFRSVNRPSVASES